MEKISINTEKIQLDQFLKWAGILESGGQVRPMLDEGLIFVNGVKETAKRKQLHPGDVVKIIDIGEYEVVRED
ncbi:MAG: RNA-binding S4 domain-containing protein [Selenomonadales bacterium]|jgi:ribosome-associated protein|nr:RNA-binding S4 domain-containing protein [Selenomonadales bacterium]MDY3739850.1 RNA-binding S4 domain-containing protein [Selenomonadaceae bacterium]